MGIKKVLILHGQPGMGHLMPAKAIVEAFSKKYPEIEVKDVDAFIFFNKIIRDGYAPFYNYIVSKIPIIFKFFYYGYGNKPMQGFLKRIALFFTKKSEIISFIKNFSPDFILATNPAPLQMLSLIDEKKIIDIPSANVCTDFGFHALWYNSNINYYFVANEAVKKSLVDMGARPETVKITGIPIAKKYSEPLDNQKILFELSFVSTKPTLLIIGGQLTYRELSDVVSGIKKNNDQVQFIIVSGRDKQLQKELENSELKKDPKIKIFNLVNNLQEYMAVSDLVLSKAGGSTVAECLAMGLPMIFSRIIVGQEEDNVEYLINNGVGIKAAGAPKIVETIVDLFSHPEKLIEMKENCKKISRPNSAIEIADFVVSLILV